MWVFSAAGLLFYTISRSLFSSVVYEALYRNYHCTCVPTNAEASKLEGCLQLIPLPKECDDIARIFLQEVDETAWQGPA